MKYLSTCDYYVLEEKYTCRQYLAKHFQTTLIEYWNVWVISSLVILVT